LTDLLIGFGLGIVGSVLATVGYDWFVQAKLEILLDDGPPAQGQLADRPPHQFYHLVVKQKAPLLPLTSRRPAWSCHATLEVFNFEGGRLSEPIYARWPSQPEPLLPQVAGDRVINIIDFARLMSARKSDVHAYEEQKIAVALKYDGAADYCVFSNESYMHNLWENPAWRFAQGVFRLRVTVYYDGGRSEREFLVNNSGTRRDSLSLDYSPQKTRTAT
jgi:hypothetical protein